MEFKSASVCIQDKNRKHWNTSCGVDYTAPVIRDMKRHLQRAAANPTAYKFLDLTTAKIMVNGEIYGEVLDMSDEELLNALR